jgi:hypothetical protein
MNDLDKQVEMMEVTLENLEVAAVDMGDYIMIPKVEWDSNMNYRWLTATREAQNVHVVCDENMVCKFCGQSWTTDNDTYNGGCCDKDQEAQPKEAGDETTKRQPLDVSVRWEMNKEAGDES